MVSRFSSLMFTLIMLFLVARSSPLAAQQTQDNQPHVEPRSGISTPPAKAKQSQSPQSSQPDQQLQPGQQYQPGQAPAKTEAQGESSSRDSQIDFSGAAQPNLPAPSRNDGDEKTFRPWYPHRAATDIEYVEY